jgi:Tol biopolymer transport system component
VALSDGGLFTVELTDGSEPSAVEVSMAGRTILDPTWSPTGASIAFVSEDAETQERALSVLDVQSGTVTDAVSPPEGRFVVDYAWMPDGVSLLFTEGGELAGAVTGIDLWRIDASGENRTLVASAGTVAPVARIANASPSPDGQRVAYSVLVPGNGAPQVDSVWVRDLTSGVGFRVPMPVVESIEEIWWTDRGLVISTVTRGTAQSRSPVLALLIAKGDGATDILWAAPIFEATPISGTPVASPTSR